MEGAASRISYHAASALGGGHAAASDAFGAVQDGGTAFHPLLLRAQAVVPPPATFSTSGCALDASVLITGGLGALGSLVARFVALEHRSAPPRLWLLGRSADAARRFAPHSRQTYVTAIACDTSNASDVVGLEVGLARGSDSAALSIHHAAGVLTVSEVAFLCSNRRAVNAF